MRRLSRKQKVLVFLALSVLSLLLAPFVAVQIQERIFRHRAEQLLGDMRSLMMHRASWEAIRAQFRRWNPPNRDPRSDPCPNDMCILEEFSFRRPPWMSRRYPDSPDTDWWGVWMAVYRLFGGRNAFVIARGRVRRDQPNLMFEVGAETPTHGATLDRDLIGAVSYGETPSIRDVWQGWALHPNYVIGRVLYPGHGDRFSAAIYVNFGERADAVDISRLTNFDLSCLTRLLPCRELSDLMPEAAAQFAKEEPQIARAGKEHVCGADLVPLIARTAEDAFVAEVTRNLALPPPGSARERIPRIRLIENLNPGSQLKPGEEYGIDIFDATTGRTVTSLPVEVRPGNRFIVLAQPGPGNKALQAESCGIVPLNPANLELVRQGIAGNLPPAKP